MPVIDISEISESQRDDAVQRIAAELRERSFDLRNDLPLRLALVKLGADSHVLVEVKHHIASDGWSSGIFSRELAAIYSALSQGRPNPLGELPVQYADYSLWQREWLQGEVLDRQLAYWKEQLKDIPVLELPMDGPARRFGEPCRRETKCNLVKVTGRSVKGAEPSRGRHVIHDVARGVPRLAASLHGTRRHRCGLTDCRADAVGNGRTDRLFRQHVGAAKQAIRQPDV